MQAGKAAYDADVAQKTAAANSDLAERKRQRALQAGVLQASRIGSQVRRAQGTALALAGGSGTDTTAGTAGNLQAISALEGAADEEQARANAAMQAWGFESEISELDRRKRIAGQQGAIGIGGAVLSGIGSGATALTKG